MIVSARPDESGSVPKLAYCLRQAVENLVLESRPAVTSYEYSRNQDWSHGSIPELSLFMVC
jgi:hypothetical protein